MGNVSWRRTAPAGVVFLLTALDTPGDEGYSSGPATGCSNRTKQEDRKVRSCGKQAAQQNVRNTSQSLLSTRTTSAGTRGPRSRSHEHSVEQSWSQEPGREGSELHKSTTVDDMICETTWDLSMLHSPPYVPDDLFSHTRFHSAPRLRRPSLTVLQSATLPQRFRSSCSTT